MVVRGAQAPEGRAVSAVGAVTGALLAQRSQALTDDSIGELVRVANA